MDVLLGCPILERGWCLHRWLQSVFNQGINPENLSLIFGITDGNDDTREILEKYGAKVKALYLIDANDVEAFRDRNPARFAPLAEIRNRILEKVREINPDYFFSHDSDIILPDNALLQLIEDDKELVSPYVELVPGVPNAVTKVLNANAFRRVKPIAKNYPKNAGLYKVDACFASLLFRRGTYDIVYGYHEGGEDYAAALDALEKGYEFWLDSDVIGTHLFNKDC